MTTFWCLNKACRKPIEVRRTIPDFCPHCQEPFATGPAAARDDAERHRSGISEGAADQGRWLVRSDRWRVRRVGRVGRRFRRERGIGDPVQLIATEFAQHKPQFARDVSRLHMRWSLAHDLNAPRLRDDQSPAIGHFACVNERGRRQIEALLSHAVGAVRLLAIGKEIRPRNLTFHDDDVFPPADRVWNLQACAAFGQHDSASQRPTQPLLGALDQFLMRHQQIIA